MAKIGVRLSINVSRIEKARLYKGAKGLYLDATCFIDMGEQDQYGNNGMITQDVSKEEREQKIRGPILGNVEIFYRENQSAPQPAPAQAAPQAGGFDDFEETGDRIPF